MFDRVYCIHLPCDERRRMMDAQFDVLGIKATYVHAEPPKGIWPNMRRNPAAEWGVSFSHIKAVVMAIADGAKRPLFLEDDILFKEQFPAIPEDYSVLYLGGHPRSKATLVREGLARVGTFSCAEAYSITGSLLTKFHGFWLDRIGKPNAMYDFILGEFAAAHESYAIYPPITEQAQLKSHVKGEVDDKRDLIKRGWQNNLT